MLSNTSEEPLQTIQYTVVHRFIHNFVQQHEKYNHTLMVTATSVIFHTKHLQLDKLMDVSYKPFTNGQGFLYLHTDEGVFAFLISVDPTDFIEACRALIVKKSY